MDEYLRDFVQEAEEQITELNNALLSLESDPTDRDAMDRVFRSAHTLKGNAGAMGFDEASDLAHAIEEVLDEVRGGTIEVSPELMDRVFEGVDELEVMLLDDVRTHGEPRTEASDVVAALEAEIDRAEAALPRPTDAEVDSLVESARGPTDSGHDVHHVRLTTVEEAGGENAMEVVDALTDAFDLLGTDPSREAIESGDYDGRFDALFASPVGRTAISAALDSVDAVDAFVITEATDRAQRPDDADGGGGGTSTAISVDDMSVDELLEEEDVMQFDDLDAMVEEVEDEGGDLDDLGDAGSFADLDLGEDVEPEIDLPDAGGAVDDGVDATPDDESEGDAATEAQNDETAVEADAADEPADDEVEDASATFKQLQEEVDPVGFDELQDELAELEFDELDDDDEVGFDELLGEEALEDDTFPAMEGEADLGDIPGNVDVTDDTAADAGTDDGGFGDLDLDEAAEAADAAATADADDAFDDIDFGSADDTVDADTGLEEDSVADVESDPFGDDADADPFAKVDEAETETGSFDDLESADAETSTFDADDEAESAVETSMFGDTDTESAGSSTGSEVETSDFGDFDMDDAAEEADAAATDDADDGPSEFAEAFVGDDGTEADAGVSADAASEPATTSEPATVEEEVQSVRVEVGQIDDLMNLVESLVTSRVRLRRAVERGESLAVIDEELDELEDITAELQDTVMDVRLVPLDNVVSRLPRVVRDISRDQNKQVDFEMDGADVEVDRSILNELGDPLTHVVRNAVDHGIETPEVREAAGKDETGTVELRARRERDQVIIEVTDDGRGLDPDDLRDEAVEEGVHDRATVDAMSDEEAYELVFHPGLSTTEEVTDVSGRGVGMDVVKETVRDLDGEVTVESTLGEGTTIRMALPVTVAISEMLFVEAGGEEFGVPVRAIEEIGPVRNVETVDGQEMVVRQPEEAELAAPAVAGGAAAAAGTAGDDEETVEEYPVIRLDEALGTPERGRDGRGMLVHIRDDVREVALHCDAVRGQQEVVVKPFDGMLAGIPGLSGATVLGEGDVVNILDVETL